MLKLLRATPKRSFGFAHDYKQRVEQKLTGTHKVPTSAQFFTTPTRPSNFGDHLDFKVNIDNWFDENRVHNEEDVDVRRTQIYLLNALGWGAMASLARLFALGVVNRMAGWKRYDRDSYLEVDIGALPPGEVIQIVWNGEPVFIRRLTHQEVEQEHALPEETLLDKHKAVLLNDDKNSKVLVCSAICTHLGCIPIPYLGNYKGWVCICHGSVYDKFGRVRQGPALENLKIINNSLYDDILCIAELQYPREPSVRFWA
jgi:ubiquinol-cytochrome c reductase iron-sulfur subunit